jgi:hypothetical protein
MQEPIRFVSGDLEDQWDSKVGHGVPLHYKLISLVLDFCEYAYSAHGWLPEVTSIVRTPDQDDDLGGSGIHPTGRALDIRTRNVPQRVVADCKAYIDKLWKYDKARPKMSCCYIKPHGNGPHAHLQVHPNTVKVESV